MPDGPPQQLDELPPEDELVAYLDGELDAVQSQAVESQLARDDAARRKAEQLKKTYELLDYLPQPEPSPNFATRTLTQIQPHVADAPTSTLPPYSHPSTPIAAPSPTSSLPAFSPTPRRRGWQLFGWGIAFVLAALLGYFGHLLARPHLEANDPAKRTSEQVRLLERLPLYLGVDDFEMLRLLDHADFFAEHDHDEAYKTSVETLTSIEVEKLENTFQAYPAARQQQLRKLDEELSAQDAERQSHLLGVLERYAIWLDRLPDNYRKELFAAPAAVERLGVIRVVKSRLWRESLPSALREKIDQAEGPQRDQLLAELKQQDAKRKEFWGMARREWANLHTDRRPWPFENEPLMKQVEEFFDKRIKPRLNANEASEFETLRKETTSPGGYFSWYRYGDQMLRLQELHPSLPDPAGKMVRTVLDLPDLFQSQLNRAAPIGGKRQLKNHPTSGKWPDFAEHVLKEAQDLKVPIRFALGPTKPDEYAESVKAFWDKELAPKLNPKELDEIKKLEGSAWPEHSKKLLEFARKQNLSVPTATLPGPPAEWEKVYRNRPVKK